MISCDCGEMNEGRFADCLLALKMRAMRFVFVKSAAYTTVKQKPAPNLQAESSQKVVINVAESSGISIKLKVEIEKVSSE